MSSDFSEEIEDHDGNRILFAMTASGLGDLTIVTKCTRCCHEECCDHDDLVGGFGFDPDEQGWDSASKIANAISDWVVHTRELHENKNK